jgi:hypothetical protein
VIGLYLVKAGGGVRAESVVQAAPTLCPDSGVIGGPVRYWLWEESIETTLADQRERVGHDDARGRLRAIVGDRDRYVLGALDDECGVVLLRQIRTRLSLCGSAEKACGGALLARQQEPAYVAPTSCSRARSESLSRACSATPAIVSSS